MNMFLRLLEEALLEFHERMRQQGVHASDFKKQDGAVCTPDELAMVERAANFCEGGSLTEEEASK